MANPQNRPTIPPYIPPEDVVVIIGFTTPDSSMHLTDTTIRKTRVVSQNNIAVGTDVFLLRSQTNTEYVFGRPSIARSNRRSPDVYLTGINAGQQQFKLVPDWEKNAWRIDAMSETKSIVNGVVLQKLPTRTRRPKNPFPHVLYLDSRTSNHVAVRDVQMNIWLLKSPREITTSEHRQPDPIDSNLQDVSSRDEEWAQQQYILLSNSQISNQSHAVLQRFTGRVMVAKMFGDPNRRDVEFDMLNKPQVDPSIVRYRQATLIDGTPAVITDKYEGFRSYASLRPTLREMHPGLRFEAATKLILRLFAALESLHFQGIVHDNVTHNSVLIRIVNDRIERVLLVDYSSARTFNPGDIAPREAMIADGKAVIQLIDDLCSLWTLRKAPAATAKNENLMRKRMEEAAEKCETVQRCLHDYTENQGNSGSSGKGKRLSELLESSTIDWQSAQADMIHNSTLKEVGYISRPALEGLRSEYLQHHEPPALGTGICWNLSLGHPFLDGLVTKLYHNDWDQTPREICEKIREIAGTVEEPWQTFDVTLTFAFDAQAQLTDLTGNPNLVAFTIESIVHWLAVSCEVFPEWRPHLQADFANTVSTTELGINRDALNGFRRMSSVHGILPSSLHQVFDSLLSIYDRPSQSTYTIDVDYQVWYHQPSRMFNATQLQRLASPEDLRSCIAERKVTCDNFAEVRGSSELEGCYVPMALLRGFIESLGLTVRNPPDTSIGHPTFNPSDFSQVAHQYRVVLARRGLLGYASIVRSIDQCGWSDKPKSAEEVETPAAFLPTYFGDFKVFPELPYPSQHPRPDHWARFVSASSAAADISTQQQIGRESPHFGLPTVLRQRENIRAAAFRDGIHPVEPATYPGEPATRRVLPTTTTSPYIAVPVQGRDIQRLQSPAITRQNSKSSVSRQSSFLQQATPNVSHSFDQSVTVADVAPVGEGDWEKVEQWLIEEANKNSASQHLFDYQFESNQDGSETEADSASPSSVYARKTSEPGCSLGLVGGLHGSETIPQQIDPEVPRRDSSPHRTTSRRQIERVSFYNDPASALNPLADGGQGDESMPDTEPGVSESQELGDLPDADDTP